jgi:tetratricopeptide (TPR) repeat protein
LEKLHLNKRWKVQRKKSLESLKELSDEIIGIRLETSVTVWDKKDTKFLISEIEISFIEIRKIAIEQQMTIIGKEAEVYEKELREEITTSLIRNDLRDFLWWVLKANLYLKFEDNYNNDDALKYINKALKIDPLDFDALILKGDILLELEKEIEALIAYDMASIVKPDDIIPLVLKGNTLYKIGKYSDALDVYDAALEIKLRAATPT